MSTKIGGFDSGPVQVGTSRTVKRSGDAPRSSGSGGAASTSGDTQISDSARKLADLEQVVQSLPAVDNTRVTEVSSRIERGAYKINAEHIADKLLQSERDLQRLV